MPDIDADVAIVGASIAGCTAARLFAQQGLTVALLERNGDRAAYKRLCGDFIQPSAVGILQRLGLAELIDAAIASRNEDGVTILALFLDKARLDSFRRSRDDAFIEMWRSLPDAPRTMGEQISRLVGYVDYPVQTRQAVPRAGVVLIGDAAHSADPLWAIGCGWAFQTAGWLVKAVAPALLQKGSLARSLRNYDRVRRARIGGHQTFLALAAGSSKPNPIQKLIFSAAVHDRRTARLLHAFAAREIPVRRFLSPSVLARAVFVNLPRLWRPPRRYRENRRWAAF